MYTNLTILLLTTLLLTSCGGILYDPPTAAEYCDIDPALLATETEGNTVLKLWSNHERQWCWRSFAPFLAAKQRPELNLEVRARMIEINANPFTDQLMALAERGEAPDVAFVYHRHMMRLGDAGYLYPLDQCRQRPEFAPIPDKFWTGLSSVGQAWGVPMDMEITLLFYNKNLLRELGWSQFQIDELPNQIARGDYTMDDLVATAKAAIEKEVVEPGLALLPSRGQYGTIEGIYDHVGGRFADSEQSHFVINRQALETSYSFLALLYKHQLFDTRLAMPEFGTWGNKLLLRDATVHNRYLFWHSHISERQGIAVAYLDTPQDVENFHEHIGVSLLPNSIRGQPGYARLINSGQYVIFAEQATGRDHQQAACELLAATQASGLLQRHTQKSGHPTFTEDGVYMPEWFPSELTLETLLWARPDIANRNRIYPTILVEEGVRVELGELTPSEAVDVAVERLQDALGGQLIVE